jgi:hypothetical protein
MPSLLETVVDWTVADGVFNSVPRVMWMQNHFLPAALCSKTSRFRKYMIEQPWSEMRLMRHVLEFEGMMFEGVDCAFNITDKPT